MWNVPSPLKHGFVQLFKAMKGYSNQIEMSPYFKDVNLWIKYKNVFNLIIKYKFIIQELTKYCKYIKIIDN